MNVKLINKLPRAKLNINIYNVSWLWPAPHDDLLTSQSFQSQLASRESYLDNLKQPVQGEWEQDARCYKVILSWVRFKGYERCRLVVLDLILSQE